MSASPPLRRKAKTGKTLPTYSVPTEIYTKAIAEINQPEPRQIVKRLSSMCHYTSLSRFNATRRPNCESYFMEAARQSLEDRNFGFLYKIINRAMELRYPPLTQQMHEYMYIAISHDPKITNREQVMNKFLLRVKQLENPEDRQAYLESAHTIQINVKEEDSAANVQKEVEDEPDDIDFDDDDEISDGSIDLSVFQSIKNELW